MKACRDSMGIVLVALLCRCFEASATAQDDASLQDRNDLNWVKVDRAERSGILEMIASQLRGNYEKIRTWKGDYSLSHRLILSESTVAEAYQKHSDQPESETRGAPRGA